MPATVVSSICVDTPSSWALQFSPAKHNANGHALTVMMRTEKGPDALLSQTGTLSWADGACWQKTNNGQPIDAQINRKIPTRAVAGRLTQNDGEYFTHRRRPAAYFDGRSFPLTIANHPTCSCCSTLFKHTNATM